MIHRRGFLQIIGGAAGALLASEITCARSAADLETGLDFDRAAATIELAAHRIVTIREPTAAVGSGSRRIPFSLRRETPRRDSITLPHVG